MAESYTSPTMVNGAAVDAALANGNAAQAAHADQRIFGFIPAGPIPVPTWDEATWTFSLVYAGEWSYYRNSVKYTVTGNKSVTLPGTPPASGMWWVRIAGNDGTLSASQTPWTLGPTDSDVTVCSIEINNALTPKSHLYTEMHLCDINRGMHRYEHITTGPKLVSGGVVSGYTLAGNTTAANTFGVSQAYYLDETLGVTVPELVDDDGATLKYLVRSRLAGAFTWTQSLVPYLYAPGGYIQWDNAGTLTAATAINRYINTYLLATQAGWQLVVGQANHTSLALAQAETFQSLSLTGLQLAEYIAVAQLTWRTGSYGGLGLCRLEAFARIVVSSITVTNSTGLPAPHASTHDATGSDPLTGYALTSADLADFTSGAATSGQVPTADGAGGVAWTATAYATAAQGGTADTALQPTDVDDTPADGATTAPISSHWAFAHLAKLHAPDNAIGAPGAMGFGVGICPSLPAGFAPLSGTFDAASDNYGNYRYADGSIMCWIPAFYYRVAHASNPTYGTYGVNSVDVKPYSHFGNVAAANTAGYALHRAFYDGTEQPGFFIDKYLGSNSLGANASGGTFSSLALGIPCDTDGSQSGVGAIAGCGGTNNYGMVQTACRSRGATFHSASLFMHKALALLALAHAQAATATTWCAWYDAAGTTNFPKGCNNNALGDAHDASVAYLTAGHGTYPNKPLTGSATAPAKVAHNGQGSGVMDLNGVLWEVAYGLTSDATNYYGLKPSKRLRGLTGANTTGADSLFGATGIAANYDDYGTSIGVVGGSEASTFFGSASQVLAADTSGEGWFATGAGIPLAEGGSNLFGSDGLWDYRPNELCPIVGAYWNGGSSAGVWALKLNNVRGNANYSVGGRAALFL